GYLDAESDLVAGNERVGRERHVDPFVEEEPADGVDLLMTRERNLDDREPRAIRGVHAEAVEAVENGGGLAPEICADAVATLLVHVQAGENGREGCNGRRPRIEIRGCRRLQQSLELGRAGQERGKRRVRLRQPGNENDVVIALVRVTDDAVPSVAVWAELVVAPLADDAEAVSVVDVQE